MKIINFRPKHYNGRVYAYSITTDKGTFHIDSWNFEKALMGINLSNATIKKSNAREKQELEFKLPKPNKVILSGNMVEIDISKESQ